MTSTNVFSGNFAGKPSSRVLKPPGGGHSNIFGPSDEGPKPTNVQKAAQPVNVQQPLVQKPEGNPEPVNRPEKTQVPIAAETRSFRHKLQGSAFNPITGEPTGKGTESNSEKQANSVAVRQPPGGASTKLW